MQYIIINSSMAAWLYATGDKRHIIVYWPHTFIALTVNFIVFTWCNRLNVVAPTAIAAGADC